MVDEQDSLTNAFKERIDFIESWKIKYLLQTSDQQKYFWAYILAIVTKMKLIDIQFKSQLIAMFNYSNDDEKKDEIDRMDIDIDDDQLKQDKSYMDLYPGSLIAPNNIWNMPVINTDKDAKNPNEWAQDIFIIDVLNFSKITVSEKTFNKHDSVRFEEHRSKTLQKIASTRYSFIKEKDFNVRQSQLKANIYYFNNSNDELKPSKTMFHEDEAILLIFAEMVRKFVLESQYPDLQRFLWPWTENYHYKNRKRIYLYLISKYNLSQFFETKEIIDLWKNYIKNRNVTQCAGKSDQDYVNDSMIDLFQSVYENKHVHIRHQRKLVCIGVYTI